MAGDGVERLGLWRRALIHALLHMTILLWVLAVIFVVVGLAGILLPALPGTILIFAGLLLAAWADGVMFHCSADSDDHAARS